MKRFLLFTGNLGSSSGGWHDLKGSFDSIQAAQDLVKSILERYGDNYHYDYEWCHIVDYQQGKEVMYFELGEWKESTQCRKISESE